MRGILGNKGYRYGNRYSNGYNGQSSNNMRQQYLLRQEDRVR